MSEPRQSYPIRPFLPADTMALRDLYAQYVRSTGDPAALRAANRLALGLLSLGPTSSYAACMVRQCLEVGLTLPRSLQPEWLKLLAEEQDRLWRDDPNQPRSPHETEAGRLTRRLDNAWSRRGLPCHRLLSACGNIAIVREALELGVELTLQDRKPIDNDAYRMLLSATREFSNGTNAGFTRALREVTATYPTGAAARTALEPLFAAVRFDAQKVKSGRFENFRQIEFFFIFRAVFGIKNSRLIFFGENRKSKNFLRFIEQAKTETARVVSCFNRPKIKFA